MAYPCAIFTKNLPYGAEIQGTVWGEPNTWALNVADEVGIRLQIACPQIKYQCEYQVKELSLSGTNGSPTTIAAIEIQFLKVGGFCTELLKLDANYNVISPEGFTVS